MSYGTQQLISCFTFPFPSMNTLNQGRIPSPRILKRVNACEVYGIMHFGLNTFTDREWGYGDENPRLFAPAAFDAEQIVRACRDGGLKGLVLVCKHHDGFCLWPTKTTTHNISASPFRNGHGDLVKEVADACRKYGLGFGIYVSPWDRNNAEYGTPRYLELFREQLRELYTAYGPAFEVWFDGANGGDGYYGGARETRRIDQSTYYDWPNTWQIVRDLQPDACIFSDVGPDVRWPGNERGLADHECFSSITPKPAIPGGAPAPGYMDYANSPCGNSDGAYFIPPECDVPLRPGWFYHQEQDGQQKSVRQLAQIYLRSVGCGGFLNLGIAPDKRGQLETGDVERLRQFKKAVDLLNGPAIAEAPFTTLHVGEALTLKFSVQTVMNLLDMREELDGCGEQLLAYRLEARKNGEWTTLLSGKAVGLRRMKALEDTECDAIRLVVEATRDNTPVRLSLACRKVPRELLEAEGDKARIKARKDYQKLDITNTGDTVAATFNAPLTIRGFLFTPLMGLLYGLPEHYRFEVEVNGEWQVCAEGEFANIKANPIPQEIHFPPVCATACRLVATRKALPAGYVAVEELGVLV